MRGSKAKKLRKEIYGDVDHKFSRGYALIKHPKYHDITVPDMDEELNAPKLDENGKVILKKQRVVHTQMISDKYRQKMQVDKKIKNKSNVVFIKPRKTKARAKQTPKLYSKKG